MLAREGI